MKRFPLPHERADINAALMRHSMLSPYVKGKLNAVKLMPRYGQQKRRQSDREIKSVMKSWGDQLRNAAAK